MFNNDEKNVMYLHKDLFLYNFLSYYIGSNYYGIYQRSVL